MQTHLNSAQTSAQTPGASSAPRGAATWAELAERRLVQRVFARCDDVIRQACAFSSIPPEFLGALTANESGGRADAQRFEPAAYRHLQAVARGETPAYGSITLAGLEAEAAALLPATDVQLHARYLTAAFAAKHRQQISSLSDDALRELACSWGYTQIMGYHMIGRPGTPRDLLKPDVHFRIAIQLLSEFAAGYHLDLAHEFSEMFCCWNTGRPYGKTFDPQYIENGLRRMQMYRQLQSISAAAR